MADWSFTFGWPDSAGLGAAGLQLGGNNRAAGGIVANFSLASIAIYCDRKNDLALPTKQVPGRSHMLRDSARAPKVLSQQAAFQNSLRQVNSSIPVNAGDELFRVLLNQMSALSDRTHRPSVDTLRLHVLFLRSETPETVSPTSPSAAPPHR
jgi:hypothetical protein